MSSDDNRITQHERVRRMLEAATSSIVTAYLQAQDDADAVGYREHNGRYSNSRGSSELTATESAAERLLRSGDFAAKWLNDVYKLARQLMYLGTMAERHWPTTPAEGDEVDGVKIGSRTNTVEICVHCGEPVPAGRLSNGRSTIVRVDGQPYHRNTCYLKLLRTR